jgi:hypothetical protein
MSQSGTFQPSWEGSLGSPNDSFREQSRQDQGWALTAANDAKRSFFHEDGCGIEIRVFRVETAPVPLKSSWPGPLHADVQE